MDVGYNLVERTKIGKEFEEIEEKISIVEFLRKLQKQEPIPRKISVSGLEEALFEGSAPFIRSILSQSIHIIRTHIIQLPINGELILNEEPKIKYRGKELILSTLFGNRIILRAIGYFHSTPYI